MGLFRDIMSKQYEKEQQDKTELKDKNEEYLLKITQLEHENRTLKEDNDRINIGDIYHTPTAIAIRELGTAQAIATGDMRDSVKRIADNSKYLKDEMEAKKFYCKIETSRFSHFNDDCAPFDLTLTCHGGGCENCDMQEVIYGMLVRSNVMKKELKKSLEFEGLL